MEVKIKCENKNENLNNIPIVPIGKENSAENFGYNCSECSSLIEILSIKDDNISFNCENNHNINNIKLKEYLEKMKKYNNDKNLNDLCQIHNNVYICYCFDCKSHFCNECLKNKKHTNHNKKYIPELTPDENDINEIKKRIEYYKNKIKDIKKAEENKVKEMENE